MAEIAIFFLVVFGLAALGLLLLACYLGVKILQLVGRIIGGVFRGFGNAVSWLFGIGRKAIPNHVHCSRPACGEANPLSAKFCRRCGRTLCAEYVDSHRVPPPIPSHQPVGSR